MKLIDKDALVAEIERRISQLESKYKELSKLEIWITAKEIEHKINGLKEALSIINTLEVKEVDLSKEIDNYFDNYKFAKKEECWLNHDQTYIFAKHFFELGMTASNKAQKGE